MVTVSLPRPFRKPRSRAQAAALTCPATFLKYGGAAGSLKTSTAIEAAAQFRDNPHMFSIILRKTALELRDIMNEADQLYSQAAGKMNWSEDTCYFPSGARVMFGYAVRDREIHKYQGPSFCVAIGTPVLMADGSYKNIESICVGDLVSTLEGPKLVTATKGQDKKPCVKAKIFDSNGNFISEQVHPETHPFLMPFGWDSYASLAGNQTCSEASDDGILKSSRPQVLCVPVVLHVPDPHLDVEFEQKSKQSRESCKLLKQLDRTTASLRHEREDQWRPFEPFRQQQDRFAYCDEMNGGVPDPNTAPSSQFDCHPLLGSCDGLVLGDPNSAQEIFPSLGGADKRTLWNCTKDVLDSIAEYSPQKFSGYVHPYTKETRPLFSSSTFGVCELSPCGIVSVCDLTVEDANHYISSSRLINKNSFIDFDESVFFGEYAIRFMFSRLRSASRIPLRLWLTTNPGGVSHDMHMHIFQGKTCIHCNPTKDSRKAYVIYNDAVWPSDGRPVWDREVSPTIPVTTCFIPGRIIDHDIYGKKGERYLGSLGALDAKLREAMMNGCWAQFLGQYFDVWNPNIHVVQRRAIREANWWPYWSGGDYGFKKSWATDYLFTRDPEGHIYTLAEIAENHFKARDFGARVRAEWFPDDFRVSQANYLSPDCWAQRGDDQTLADQIEDEGRGLMCTPASTDRAGGAQLVYTLLSDQKLFVTEDCPLLIKSIPSRIHDEKEPTKVKKVDGDPCDDAWDAWRYGVYSHCQETQEPREIRIQRRVTAEDPTTRAMQRRIAERDLEQEEEAGSVVDYAGWGEWRDV